MDAKFEFGVLNTLAQSVPAMTSEAARDLAREITDARLLERLAFTRWSRVMKRLEGIAQSRAGIPYREARRGAPPVRYRLVPVGGGPEKICEGLVALQNCLGNFGGRVAVKQLAELWEGCPQHPEMWVWEEGDYKVFRLPEEAT